MTPTLEEQILVTLIRLQQDMADISKRLESLEYTVKVQREEQAKRLPVSKVIWFNFYHYLRKRSKCIYHVTFISLHQDMADISKTTRVTRIYSESAERRTSQTAACI